MKLKVTVNGIAYSVDVEVEEEQRKLGSIITGGGGGVSNTPAAPTTASVEGMSSNAVVAPLAGSVFKILVNEGDEIEAGQVLLILEAMKMETEITAPNAGTVAHIGVAVGDAVQGGQALVEIN
ncbi:biotin/lipoyl-containing protein [Corynebacterium durum]|uniref:biotin/lipoyl-containing protein n=1 Tax=Corynebacterium durum TaxID=61592 RepID=UPI0028E7679F|nr:biotin/lipoyl-containing protein [Corynebacterium durum]